MTEKLAAYSTDHCKRNGARLVRHYRGGEQERWLATPAAAQIVGRYEKGATRELANELAVSPDTIESLARAYIVYRGLRTYAARNMPADFRVVSELRQKLTVSHFAEAGRLAKAHDLIPLDVFAMLQSAAEYPRTAVNRMSELVDAENGGKSATTWEGQARRAYKDLLNISTNGSAPEWLARWSIGAADTLKSDAMQNEQVEL